MQAIHMQRATHAIDISDSAGLRKRLWALYNALYDHFGHEPHWWPILSDRPQLEILIGAILVQQTRWEAVEAAVVRMRDAGLLDLRALADADTDALAAMIRPCAFHGQKAPGLRAVARAILERHGDMATLLAQERAPLREELLALPRIGRETADTIMLYAGGQPLFVVDAYTRRLFARLGLLPGIDPLRARYDDLQRMVEQVLGHLLDDPRAERDAYDLPPAPRAHAACHFYRTLHALIVEECIHHCLASNPRHDQPGPRRAFVDPRKCEQHCRACGGCPLRSLCAQYQQLSG